MQTQLQNIKLKKVVVKEENKDKNLGGTGKNFLQNALSAAIKNRRQNLHDCFSEIWPNRYKT